jgi:hypothetical protein
MIYLYYCKSIYITLQDFYINSHSEFCRGAYHTTHKSTNLLINISDISHYQNWRHRKKSLTFYETILQILMELCSSKLSQQ